MADRLIDPFLSNSFKVNGRQPDGLIGGKFAAEADFIQDWYQSTQLE